MDPGVITAIAGSVATVVIAGLREWSRWKESTRKSAIERAHVETADIYAVLSDITRSLGASTALVLYTSNGGGIPSPGREIKASILYEHVRNEGLSPIRGEFQNYLIDEAYTRMMARVVSEGRWVGDATVGGFLGELYAAQKVKLAIVLKVTNTNERFYYLSVRWAEGDVIPLPENVVPVLSGAARKIKTILDRGKR